MPTIEGKEAKLWIDGYVKKGGKLCDVTKAVRALVKKTVKGSEEYVNPWKIPTFDWHGPLCGYMAQKGHVTLILYRGTELEDPQRLLEGTGKSLRHVKLRSLADVNKPAVEKLLAEAAKLNEEEPVGWMKVGMEKRRVKK